MDFKLLEATEKGAELVVDKLKNNQLAMLSVETGGGKTYITIHAIGKVLPDAHIIIIGPKAKTIDGDWEKSIDSYNEAMNTNLTMELFNYEKFDNDKTKPKETGTRKTKAKRAKKSTFFNNLVARVRAGGPKYVLIMDEAHKIKNSTGLRAKRTMALAEEPNILAKILLTATPITNSYMDAITYLIMAGFYKNKSEFTAEHVKYWSDFHQPIVKDYDNNIRRDFFNNPEKIDKELDTFVVNFDVSNLKPDTDITPYRFDLSKDQLKEYRNIWKRYKNGEFDHIQSARKEMFDYTNQHCQKKLDAVDEILTKSQKPILIFYNYNSALKILLHHFETNHKDYDVFQMNGVVSEKKRFSGKVEPENPKTVILIQYVAGAEGWNARWSDTTIFYEPTYSYEKFNQSRGRNARAYMTNDIHHYTLGFNKTLEDAVWGTVDGKQSFSDSLIESFFDDEISIGKVETKPEPKTSIFNLSLNMTLEQAQNLKKAIDEMNIEITDSKIIQ